MATPHVAGAAAILKQEHPDWTYAELKGALTGSAKGGEYTPFQQGSGRIQVDKAIEQTVVAEPVSVSFGVAAVAAHRRHPGHQEADVPQPRHDGRHAEPGGDRDRPEGPGRPGRLLHARRDEGHRPGGRHGRRRLTVNTKLGGTLDGAYSAYVTATGGGQTVRTAAAVEREVESYDVTLKHINRAGQHAGRTTTDLAGCTGLATAATTSRRPPAAPSPSASAQGHVPPGRVPVVKDPAPTERRGRRLAGPARSWTSRRNTTVTLDAAPAKVVRHHGAGRRTPSR